MSGGELFGYPLSLVVQFQAKIGLVDSAARLTPQMKILPTTPRSSAQLAWAERAAGSRRGQAWRPGREKSLLGNVQFGGPAEKQSTLGRHVHKILAVRGNYILPIFVDRAVRRGGRTVHKTQAGQAWRGAHCSRPPQKLALFRSGCTDTFQAAQKVWIGNVAPKTTQYNAREGGETHILDIGQDLASAH